MARRLIAGIWLLVLVALAAYSGWRVLAGTAFESNIMGLVPGAPQALQDDGVRERFERRFVVLVSGPDQARGLELARRLQSGLAATGALADEEDPGQLRRMLSGFYRPYRHQLLTPEWRRRLQNETPEQLAEFALRQLHSPVGDFRPYDFRADPFNLGGAWLQSLLPDHSGFASGDVAAVGEGETTWYLVSGELRDSPFALASQQAVARALTSFEDQHPSATVLRSGVVFHAQEATALARTEISTVGLGSLLAILVLVVTVFRSRASLLAIVFTLGSSVLFALGACLMVFPRVHLITVAFGATLLGLAVDYCFHFLAHYRRFGDSGVAGQVIARGLLLSAGSSVLAYGIQLFSPFAGLHQFAVFMVAGLVGACGAVAVLSLCFRDRPVPALDRWLGFYPRRIAPVYRRIAAWHKSAMVALVMLAVAMVAYVGMAGSRDDIRSLNASSDELLASEEKVRSLLGGTDPQRFFYVTGDDPQVMLARTRQLVKTLETESNSGPLASESLASEPSVSEPLALRAVTRLVPPLSVQQSDRALVAAKLYGNNGAIRHLCERLDVDCGPWRNLPGPLAPGLVPAAVPDPLAAIFPELAATDGTSTLVLLGQGAHRLQSPSAIAASLEGVEYVDRVAGLSATLADYRRQVTFLLAGFLLLFAIACLTLYRQSGLVVVASLGMALAVGLGTAAAGGITLFHILALLLVLGLAVDTALFYRELGLTGETWLASSLATATSVLAFGLLALSQVPVLHHFGSVVFAGLLCSWLVTPLIFHLWRPAPTDKPPQQG